MSVCPLPQVVWPSFRLVVYGGATRLLGLLCPILRGEADEEEQEEVVEVEESTTATSMAAAAAVDSRSSSKRKRKRKRKMIHQNGVEVDQAVVTMPP
jgi:hypothetical protein